jgi:hypothetical protein
MVAMDLSGTQPADTLSAFGTEQPLPRGMAPAPTDNLGVPWSGGIVPSSSSTVAYQNIGIKRVISYLTDPAPPALDGSPAGGTVRQSVFDSGIISKNARLSIFLRIDCDQRDYGKPFTIVWRGINSSSNIMITDTFSLGSQLYYQIPTTIIPSNWLNYGLHQFDPTQTSALQLASEQAQNSTKYQPIVGLNGLQYSVYSDPSMLSSYILSMYSYLQFNAAEPILMVHGTAANHKSWNEPPGSIIPTNVPINYGPIYPFVSGNGVIGYFDAANSGYQGTWFSYIDIGVNTGGNNSIIASAISPNADDGTLISEIPAILDALGTRSCHLIAHSKGGSDCRYFISEDGRVGGLLMHANDFDPDNLIKKYKILSLYTIGTPSRGTPLSDISSALGAWPNNITNSSNAEVLSTANLSSIANFKSNFSNDVPQGNALLDQTTSSPTLANLNTPETMGTINSILQGHLYSVIGDADLDQSGDINGGEGDVLYPAFIPNFCIDHIWNTVGSVGSIKANPTVSVGGPNSIGYIDLVPQNLSPSVEPNDLVVPIWSAIAPGANILLVPWPNNFGAVSGFPSSLSNFDYSTIAYSSVLSPGNHSLLKSFAAADIIVQKIFTDYPTIDP